MSPPGVFIYSPQSSEPRCVCENPYILFEVRRSASLTAESHVWHQCDFLILWWTTGSSHQVTSAALLINMYLLYMVFVSKNMCDPNPSCVYTEGTDTHPITGVTWSTWGLVYLKRASKFDNV